MGARGLPFSQVRTDRGALSR